MDGSAFDILNAIMFLQLYYFINFGLCIFLVFRVRIKRLRKHIIFKFKSDYFSNLVTYKVGFISFFTNLGKIKFVRDFLVT